MPYCGHCGFEYTPKMTQAFCLNCGSRLEEPTVVASGTMQLARVPRFFGKLVLKGGETFELTRDRINIGSAPHGGIVLDDSSVSPLHAVVRVSHGVFVIYDAGSAGGTWVNEEPVTGEMLSTPSRISIGSSELLFTAGEPGQHSGTRGAIVVRSGPAAGLSFPVGDEDFVIGRRPGNDGLVLNDPTASQRHALLHPTPDGCVLCDLGSNNGTSVDGVPLRGRPLYDEDQVRLGDVRLAFVQDDAAKLA